MYSLYLWSSCACLASMYLSWDVRSSRTSLLKTNLIQYLLCALSISNMRVLLIIPILLGVASAGNFLFYMPFVTKSMMITFMPVAEELGKRGHKVSVVIPAAHNKQLENVEQIVVPNLMEEASIKRAFLSMFVGCVWL